MSFVGASSSLASSARLVAAALQQDPNIFNYDDSVQAPIAPRANTASDPTPAVSSQRPGSRYIASLVRAASEREKHRAAVQQVTRQKEIEREEQMEQFKGKERFVTAAYKQQLQQTQQLSERDKPQWRQPQPELADVESAGSTRVDSRVTEAAGSSAVDGATAASSAEWSEPSNSKRRRVHSETEQAAVRDRQSPVHAIEQKQCPASDEASGDVTVNLLPTRVSTSPPRGHSGVSVGSAEDEEASKRAAARDRFIARRRAAAHSHSNG